MDENRVIGNGNSLPWPKEKSDLKFFKEKTSGGSLIMGRKTFQGLGTLHLVNRKIYVLTHFNPYSWSVSNLNFQSGSATTHIIKDVNDLPEQDYWVCGGKAVYELFLPKMCEFFVTYIKGQYEGDVIMPEFEKQFKYSKTIDGNMNYHTVWYWK